MTFNSTKKIVTLLLLSAVAISSGALACDKEVELRAKQILASLNVSQTVPIDPITPVAPISTQSDSRRIMAPDLAEELEQMKRRMIAAVRNPTTMTVEEATTAQFERVLLMVRGHAPRLSKVRFGVVVVL